VQYPDPATLPDAYDQPHRKLQELIIRDSDVTLKIIGDLEKRINPDYGYLENKGFIWSSVGGHGRSYSPATNTLQLTGESHGLGLSQNAIQWCTGHGFAKCMNSIESITPKDDHVLVKGMARVFQIDQCTMELEFDQDLIVRRAVVATPATTGGSNEYRITTQGAVQAVGAPALAERGHAVRVLKPDGKPEREYTKHDIAFVSLSEPLSDEAYAAATRIDLAPGTQTVDLRFPGRPTPAKKQIDKAKPALPE
jgi:hypothetical protein